MRLARLAVINGNTVMDERKREERIRIPMQDTKINIGTEVRISTPVNQTRDLLTLQATSSQSFV